MTVEGFSLSEDESEVNAQRGVVCKRMCTRCGWVLKELGGGVSEDYSRSFSFKE